MPRLSEIRHRVKHIVDEDGRDCCTDCKDAPKVKMRLDFDGKVWSGDSRAADQVFAVVTTSDNAKHLVKRNFNPREPLPSLDAPGWIEGVAQRDVC